SGTSYSNVLALAGGDRLDFVVGRGADGRLSGSGLKIQAFLTILTTNVPPPPPPPVGTYDIARDYSTNGNPSGVWSYGYKSEIGGAFVVYPRFYKNPENPP